MSTDKKIDWRRECDKLSTNVRELSATVDGLRATNADLVRNIDEARESEAAARRFLDRSTPRGRARATMLTFLRELEDIVDRGYGTKKEAVVLSAIVQYVDGKVYAHTISKGDGEDFARLHSIAQGMYAGDLSQQVRLAWSDTQDRRRLEGGW